MKIVTQCDEINFIAVVLYYGKVSESVQPTSTITVQYERIRTERFVADYTCITIEVYF